MFNCGKESKNKVKKSKTKCLAKSMRKGSSFLFTIFGVLILGVVLYFVASFLMSNKSIEMVKTGSFDKYPDVTVENFLKTAISSDGEWKSSKIDREKTAVYAKFYDEEKDEWIFEFEVDEKQEKWQLKGIKVNDKKNGIFSTMLLLGISYNANKFAEKVKGAVDEAEDAIEKTIDGVSNSVNEAIEDTKKSYKDLQNRPAEGKANQLKIEEFSLKKYLSGISKNIIVSKFYPVGWSNNDLCFAYFEDSEDDAIGNTTRFIIQDMVTDKIVEELVYNLDRDRSLPSSFSAYDIAKKDEANILKLLNKYNINGSQDLKFSKVPFKTENEEFYIDIKQIKNEENEIESENVLIYKENNSKSINKYSKQGYGARYNSVIAGVFYSNKNKRVSVLKLNEEKGWEGPPNNLKVQLIGAHLSIGFR